MLKNLRLQNFRKHADLSVEFTPGINAIRAPNENGKSTMLEGIAYCFFGTKGIKDGETIADVVTYDIPVNQLRAELTFTLAHVEYTIVRSPKGAELSFGNNQKVTGQTEVTRFVEGLLGASQEMASKLMLAKQKNLGAALSGGATAAGKMIEDLAGLDLIEELRGLISEHLPAGNTESTKGTLSTLRAQAEITEQVDLAPLEAASIAASTAHEAAVAAHAAKQAELDNLDLDAARVILVDQALLEAQIKTTSARIATAQATIGAEAPPAPAEGAIAALQAKIVAQKDLAAAAKLHDELKAANVEMLWDEPLSALQAEIEKTEATVSRLKEEVASGRKALDTGTKELHALVSAYNVEKATLEGKLIKDTTCALCQKDLKDVPEVARINSPLSKALAELTAAHEAAVAALGEQSSITSEELFEDEKLLNQAQAYLKDLQAVATRARQLDLLYARAHQFITLDMSVVPSLWTWTGPTGAPQNFSGELARLQEQDRAALAHAAKVEAAQTALTAASVDLQVARDRLAELQIKDALETLGLEKELKPVAQNLLIAAQQAERAGHAAGHALELARQANSQAVAQAARARESIKATEATLAEMEANNALMKKLTAARPQITDKLWAIVLASVSTYAADVRGEKSVITRADGKFKINGRPVTGLSGSAEDALGLSIRFALTKTFLGNVDFVILDEVAAACDDQRELAMLGLLATSGFAQTILVTHSSHADAFSDNMIVL